MINEISTNDFGFGIEFTTEIDLTDADSLVLGIIDSTGEFVERLIDTSVYNTAAAGDKIVVMIEDGDFPAAGESLVQVLVRKGTALQIASRPPVIIEVIEPVIAWSL